MANTLTFILVASYLCSGIAQQDDRPPPRYREDRLPSTGFTCEGKFTERYHADPETDCQMFHICTKMNRRDVKDFRFLCPNGTVFDQVHQVCNDYYQVVCHSESPASSFGRFFESFKLSSKESTRNQEFFESEPPFRDPEYLGQNTLTNDDFQVEEYNNNKLASSRNSLHFQSGQFKVKDDTFPSATTSRTIPRVTQRIIDKTPAFTPFPSIVTPSPIQRVTQRTVGTTPKPIRHVTQRIIDPTPYQIRHVPQRVVETTPYTIRHVPQRVVETTPYPFRPVTERIIDTTPYPFRPVTERIVDTTPYPIRPVTERIIDTTPTPIVRATERNVDTTQSYPLVPRSSSVSSGKVPNVPKPSTTLPPLFTSTKQPNFSRRLDFPTDPPADTFKFLDFYQPIKIENGLFVPPTTVTPKTKSIFDNPQFQFNDFASLSKFQTQFHKSLKSDFPTSTEYPQPTTTFLPSNDYSVVFHDSDNSPRQNFPRFTDPTPDPLVQYSTTETVPEFSVQPRTETNTPNELRTTRRHPLFQNTFRTTYQDVTTPGPQSFKQQPTRFEQEFFRKLENKRDFIKSDDEDDYYVNRALTPTAEPVKLNHPKKIVNFEPTFAPPTTTVRPRRRRLKANVPRRQGEQANFYSRRAQSARFESKPSFSLGQKTTNDEVFKVEASINSGTAGINGFQGAQFTNAQVPQSRLRDSERRLRPKEDRGQDELDAEKTFGKSRAKKRFRGHTTGISGPSTENYVSATTYRPNFSRFQLHSSTTPEPELVTASTDEIARLRAKHKNVTGSQPQTVVTRRVTSKSFRTVKRPVTGTFQSQPDDRQVDESTRSPDYDYAFFDTDNGRQVADSVSKIDGFGGKYIEP